MSEVIKQMEIKGSMATAVAFTRAIEPEAVEQIRRMLSSPAAEGSRVRIMPDVHLGKGCTIGTTMTIHDKLVPNLVGVDIGCGMYTVPLGKVELDLPRIDAAAHAIPHGFSVWEKKREDFDLTALRCYMALRDPDRLERSLGTLGGGNHFIEIDMDPDGNFYLVIHSGSRDLGRQTAEHYQNLAVELLSEKEKEEGKKEREELVRDLIEAGRKEEIQAALAQLSERRRAEALPDDLAYLTGDAMEDYLYDTAICQAFARRSREKMAEILLLSAGISPRPEGGMKTPFHTIHNYIDPRERILRKGAIAAQERSWGRESAGRTGTSRHPTAQGDSSPAPGRESCSPLQTIRNRCGASIRPQSPKRPSMRRLWHIKAWRTSWRSARLPSGSSPSCAPSTTLRRTEDPAGSWGLQIQGGWVFLHGMVSIVFQRG